MRATHVLLALACLLAGPGCVAAAPTPPPGEPGPDVGSWLVGQGYYPLELAPGDDRQLRVTGLVNGAPTGFTVDTGWPFSSLDPSRCAPLPTLEGIHGRLDGHLMAAVPRESVYIVRRFEIRDARFEDVPFTRQTLTGPPDGTGQALQGALGWDFLRRYHALVHCASRRVYLRSRGVESSVSEAFAGHLSRLGFFGAPLHAVRSAGGRAAERGASVAVRLHGADVDFLVDTGAYRSLIDSGVAHRLRLGRSAQAEEPAVGVWGRIVQMQVLSPSRLEVGGVPAGACALACTDLTAWTGAAKAASPDGLLGLDLLNTLRGWIDVDAGRLYLYQAALARR